MKSESLNELLAMKSIVDEYKWTTLQSFRGFVDDLDTRASRIQGEDHEWDKRFRNAWGSLEECYAVMVDRDLPVPDEVFRQIINSAIQSLNDLFGEVLSK